MLTNEQIRHIIKETCAARKVTFEEVCQDAGQNSRSFYNMLARKSIRLDILQKVLNVLELELVIVHNDSTQEQMPLEQIRKVNYMNE